MRVEYSDSEDRTMVVVDLLNWADKGVTLRETLKKSMASQVHASQLRERGSERRSTRVTFQRNIDGGDKEEGGCAYPAKQ